MHQPTIRFAEKMFLYLATFGLASTALSKVFSAGGTARILDTLDPVLSIPFRGVLLSVGLLELAVSGYLLSGKSTTVKYFLLLWLSTDFVLYRLFSEWRAPGRPCPCLGNLGANLPISPAAIDGLLKLMVAYLFLGSVIFLILKARLSRFDVQAISRSANPS